jgi:pimeloyl-ACP methyl ester carboxylesterase
MTGHHPNLLRFPADDGAVLTVQVTGSGSPLVLLHEWAGDHRAWAPFVRVLGERFTTYAWDARGHGTRQGRDPVTLARMSRDLANLFDHFGLSQAIVVAHSMGALTLWHYLGEAGCQRLKAICIIDQSPKIVTDDDWRLGIYGDFPAERSRRFVEGLLTDLPAAVLGLVADGHNERARRQIAANSEGIRRLRHRLEQLDPVPLAGCWTSLGEADLRPVLPRITVPTLLIYGMQSNYYGPQVADYVHRCIAGSVLHCYDDADHSPHQGHRQRFLADLAGFLTNLDQRRT